MRLPHVTGEIDANGMPVAGMPNCPLIEIFLRRRNCSKRE